MTPLQGLDESTSPEIVDGTYHLECLALEEMESGKYGGRMKWTFKITDAATGEVVCWDDDDGNDYDWWVVTSTKMGKGQRTANARRYSEALLGREFEDDEDPEEIAGDVIGKTMTATIAENEKGYPTIVTCKPFKKAKKGNGKGKSKKAKPEPEPDDDDEDDDEELPF